MLVAYGFRSALVCSVFNRSPGTRVERLDATLVTVPNRLLGTPKLKSTSGSNELLRRSFHNRLGDE